MYLKRIGGHRIASEILSTLEAWTKELRFEKCILETGKNSQKRLRCIKKIVIRLCPIMGNTLM